MQDRASKCCKSTQSLIQSLLTKSDYFPLSALSLIMMCFFAILQSPLMLSVGVEARKLVILSEGAILTYI